MERWKGDNMSIEKVMIVTEELIYSDYSKQRPSTKSIYVKGLKIPGEWYYWCPRCGEVIEEIPHGEIKICKECNLSMQVSGNTLSIWEEV